MMRVLLAGATGAVGRLLLPLLVRDGHEVFGCSRSESGLEQIRSQGAHAIRMDAFDREQVLAAVAGARPDVIIHQLTSLSAGNLQENARIRREGTRNLVDAALAAGTQRLIAQSIAWIYEPGLEPARETTALDTTAAEPRSTTIRGVQALESAVAEVPEHVVLRYGSFYGPGTSYAPGGLFEKRLRNGELFANDSVTSFIHVQDAAQAALQALRWPSGTYHVTDDEPARARDWLPIFANAVGVPAPSTTEGRTAAWERGASNALARGLGWQPKYRSWRVGFAAPAG
jgi:nucleoside-diphosphate-sugar epimerase